uniref:Perilipin 3 n=1 Tax=Oryzias sinensis TaxID=183150 RepID=A0A8C7X3M8_9TELE
MFARLIVSENRLGVNTKNVAKNAGEYSSRCVRALTSPCVNVLHISEFGLKLGNEIQIGDVNEVMVIRNGVVSETVGKVYQSLAGAVMGGVELTRAAVSGGFSSVMSSRMGQMVSSGMGLALSRSEDWVDHNLPLTERELAAVAEPAGTEVATSSDSPSYFVRLGKLSAKVQERALESSLIRAQRARDATYAAVAQITSTLDLVESARAGLGAAGNQIGEASEQLLQRWKEWKQQKQEGAQSEADGSTGRTPSELEWRALSMVQDLSQQLRSACSSVVSSAQGLPAAVQEQLTNARQAADELQSSLGGASNITPVLLERSRHQLTQVQNSLDGVMEYLLHNTPLNWLVGPFVAQRGEEEPADVAMEQMTPRK